MKKTFKMLLIIISLVIVLALGFFAWIIMSDYKPQAAIELAQNPMVHSISDTNTYSMMSWNIGYAGMGSDMDFFYDGGKTTRTTEQRTRENMDGIKKYLEQHPADFVLLQEIDTNSKRSWNMNQWAELKQLMPSKKAYFGKNYDVAYVPVPITSPMGKVVAGLGTFSSFEAMKAIRYQFPGEYSFPTKLFMLDRCFMVLHIPICNGKELLVINSHNEAFDAGEMRKAQMASLRAFLLEEYKKGNYVIVGADWNQCPPNLQAKYTDDLFDSKEKMDVQADLLPADWQWVVDPSQPSNRRAYIPYTQGTTPTTIIDFFLLSPNIEVVDMKTENLHFKDSDHNPIHIHFKFKK